MTFQLYSSILLILFSYIPVKSLASENNFENVETVSECRRLFNGPPNSVVLGHPRPTLYSECSFDLHTDLKMRPESTFEVFQMYGPCSPSTRTTPTNMPSTQDILHRERQRVEYLQARFKTNSTTKKYDSRFQDTKETADLPVSFSTSNYAISISLGRPQQVQTLIFDTASDITWTNRFHPYASNSLYIISCASPLCSMFLPRHTCEKFSNIENACYYRIEYASGLYSKGVFSMDILNITQTGEIFPQFLFGCHTDANFDPTQLYGADGVLGLGRTPISFVSQTEPIYKGNFSYCFPSSTSSTGFLKLGPRDYPNNMKFTKLIFNPNSPLFYFINITSIRVGHVELSIQGSDWMFPGTIIDTGTVVTRLPMNVYRTMRNEFQKQMQNSGYNQMLPFPGSIMDTCYNNNIDLINSVPIITFTFEGGVAVDMDASATLYALGASNMVCLAFSGNSDSSQLNIFGNTQQKKLEVVYDVVGGKLGFIPGGCL
ncbi:hypothetical protein CASFOL_038629 [Castilleja foliolosa]|uniref:Peptidase A1 domain-containing protein n=1 Tax=Castilleja foliolosa TaxID=1961234 RepID=A0ABD3BLG9_9LAMI